MNKDHLYTSASLAQRALEDVVTKNPKVRAGVYCSGNSLYFLASLSTGEHFGPSIHCEISYTPTFGFNFHPES